MILLSFLSLSPVCCSLTRSLSIYMCWFNARSTYFSRFLTPNSRFIFISYVCLLYFCSLPVLSCAIYFCVCSLFFPLDVFVWQKMWILRVFESLWNCVYSFCVLFFYFFPIAIKSRRKKEWVHLQILKKHTPHTYHIETETELANQNEMKYRSKANPFILNEWINMFGSCVSWYFARMNSPSRLLPFKFKTNKWIIVYGYFLLLFYSLFLWRVVSEQFIQKLRESVDFVLVLLLLLLLLVLLVVVTVVAVAAAAVARCRKDSNLFHQRHISPCDHSRLLHVPKTCCV